MVYNRMDQGWGTVALIPLEDILKETRDGVRNILGIAGASLLLALGMVLLISGYFNGRIRSLAAQTAKIQSGDFKGRIQIRGNDEIEQLSRTVNNMTERLEGPLKTRCRPPCVTCPHPSQKTPTPRRWKPAASPSSKAPRS